MLLVLTFFLAQNLGKTITSLNFMLCPFLTSKLVNSHILVCQNVNPPTLALKTCISRRRLQTSNYKRTPSLSYRFILLCTVHQMFKTKTLTRNECTCLLYIYIFSIMCMSSLSSPPHLVRPASRPCLGKNFGAVCNGVVDVPLDELLPPPVTLASLVLGCARLVAE
jgi:hypothetical protein